MGLFFSKKRSTILRLFKIASTFQDETGLFFAMKLIGGANIQHFLNPSGKYCFIKISCPSGLRNLWTDNGIIENNGAGLIFRENLSALFEISQMSDCLSGGEPLLGCREGFP